MFYTHVGYLGRILSLGYLGEEEEAEEGDEEVDMEAREVIKPTVGLNKNQRDEHKTVKMSAIEIHTIR